MEVPGELSPTKNFDSTFKASISIDSTYYFVSNLANQKKLNSLQQSLYPQN